MKIIWLIITISVVIGEFLFKGRLYDLRRRDMGNDFLTMIFNKIYKVDNRMLMYAVLSIPIGVITMFQLLTLIYDGIKDKGVISRLILCLLMLLVNFIFAMLSKKIIGIEENKIKVKDILRIFVLYLGFNFYYSFYLGKETIFFKSLLIIPVVYNLVKEGMFAYIVMWYNYFFGKEEVYKDETIQIIKIYINSLTRYKVFIKEVNKTFLISEEVMKEYEDKVQGTSFLGSIKVKSSIFCDRMIISEIW